MLDRDERVDAALAEYLAACDAGDPPQRAAFLARFPDLADSLAAFLDDHERMRRAADLDRASCQSPAQRPLGTVRYVGDYELLEEIARGGMGVVYRAGQVSVNRVVALKMILAGSFATEADLRRFRVEAEAAANLDHPNILPIYEVSEHDGQPYFTMKLAEGGSLEKRIGELPVRQAAALLLKLARAVHFAHQRGILHRDLKPANVLLDAHGEPLIADFGLAKRVDGGVGATQSGAIVGTPAYMSPEQARGQRGISTAADTYALGAILYECLTGRPPFRAATAAETIVMVMTEEPIAVRQLNAKVPVDLETICARCLQKDAAKRYASAQELADDLGRYLNGEPIVARPVGAIERAVKWVRRNKVVSGLAAAVLLVLTAGVGVSAWFAYVANEKTNEAEKARKDAERDAAAARAQARRAEDARHAIQIDLALRAREQCDYERMGALLGAMRPEYADAWETCHVRYLWLRHTRPLRTFKGPILARSPDGRRIVTGSEDKPLHVWDVETGKQLALIEGHAEWGRGVAFSPDGKHILTTGYRTTRVWDAQTGEPLAVLKGHQEGVKGVAFSPDGKR